MSKRNWLKRKLRDGLMVKVLTADPSSFMNRERPVKKSCLPRHPVLTDVADSQQKKGKRMEGVSSPCLPSAGSVQLSWVGHSVPSNDGGNWSRLRKQLVNDPDQE